MKRVLITGANSYVGTNVEKWLMREPDKYDVETLDMKNPNWREFDFSSFDVVFHVAGIAHVKETKNNKSLFFSINRDLAAETARISKNANIRHFIFLSTMSVYGDYIQEISEKTSVNPTSNYGLSKLEAEKLIIELEDECFKVTVIRPPMIYGPNCKGNYSKLRKIAKKVPVFPYINNKRTFLFIDNFSIYIEKIIWFEQSGVKHPHNIENVSTTDLIRTIANANDKKIIYSKILYKFLCLIPLKKIKKLIKNQYYVFSNDIIGNYSFDQSIIITEENWNEVKN